MAAASPLNHPISHPRLFDLPDLGRWQAILLGALLVALVPAGAVTVREVVARLAASEHPVVTDSQPAAAWPTRVVPVEWRWSPPGVDVDRMFRQRR